MAYPDTMNQGFVNSNPDLGGSPTPYGVSSRMTSGGAQDILNSTGYGLSEAAKANRLQGLSSVDSTTSNPALVSNPGVGLSNVSNISDTGFTADRSGNYSAVDKNGNGALFMPSGYAYATGGKVGLGDANAAMRTPQGGLYRPTPGATPGTGSPESNFPGQDTGGRLLSTLNRSSVGTPNAGLSDMDNFKIDTALRGVSVGRAAQIRAGLAEAGMQTGAAMYGHQVQQQVGLGQVGVGQEANRLRGYEFGQEYGTDANGNPSPSSKAGIANAQIKANIGLWSPVDESGNPVAGGKYLSAVNAATNRGVGAAQIHTSSNEAIANQKAEELSHTKAIDIAEKQQALLKGVGGKIANQAQYDALQHVIDFHQKGLSDMVRGRSGNAPVPTDAYHYDAQGNQVE